MDEKKEKNRTALQNRALHLYYEIVADTLNEAGLDMKVMLPKVNIPWNKDTVKEYLWRPIQKEQLLKTSTTQLTTKDIDLIFDTLNRHLSEHGVTIPFPSIETIIEKQRELDQIHYKKK